MLSIVIPVFNEAESLAELHQELDQVAGQHGYELQIIFIDDGSTDESWSVIETLAEQDARVEGIRFRRNFGKAAALSAGFEAARGEFVFTLDADLQDDPKEMPRFLAEMDEGFDVVSGWKKVRHDPWHKVGPSRVFNWLVGRITKVRLHDHNCGYKCYRREIFQEVRIYGELHRFVPVLAAARGWKVGEIVVHHRRRKYGHSKYGVRRIVKGFLDLLTVYFVTGFAQRPQHLLGSVGLVCFSMGAAGMIVLSVWWGVSRLDNLAAWWSNEPLDVARRLAIKANDLHLHERAVFYFSIVAFLLGAQFTAVGFVAELMAANQAKQTPSYSIRQRVGRE